MLGYKKLLYSKLTNSFQDGVDTLYNKCVSCGSTPSEKTPTAIASSIQELKNNSSPIKGPFVHVFVHNNNDIVFSLINSGGSFSCTFYSTNSDNVHSNSNMFGMNFFSFYKGKGMSAATITTLKPLKYCKIGLNSSSPTNIFTGINRGVTLTVYNEYAFYLFYDANLM